MMSDSTAEDAEFSLVPADICPRCNQAVDISSPNWLTFHIDFKNNRFTWEEEEHPPDKCLRCTLDVLSPQARKRWESTALLLQTAREEIYLPPNITLFHQRTRNPTEYPRVGGIFQIDYFFILTRGRTDKEWRIPFFTVKPDGGSQSFTVMISRMALTLEGVTAKVAISWDLRNFYEPQSKFEIVDWDKATRKDLRRLLEGGVLFARALPRGRPRLPVYPKQHYIDLYRKVLVDLGRPKSMAAFCEAAAISPDTLRDNLQNWGLTWTEFREEAAPS